MNSKFFLKTLNLFGPYIGVLFYMIALVVRRTSKILVSGWQEPQVKNNHSVPVRIVDIKTKKFELKSGKKSDANIKEDIYPLI